MDEQTICHLPFTHSLTCCSRFKWLFVNVSISRMKKPPKPIPCSRMKTTKIAAMINHFWNNEQKQKSTPKKNTLTRQKRIFLWKYLYIVIKCHHIGLYFRKGKNVFSVFWLSLAFVVVAEWNCARDPIVTHFGFICLPFLFVFNTFGFVYFYFMLKSMSKGCNTYENKETDRNRLPFHS